MKISIALVICTYNNALLLSRTLNAIAQQQIDNSIDWQVLVVNNNCTDDTEAVVTYYQEKIRHLAMVRESCQGLTSARLCGVKRTSTDWIAFVDDDCLIAPDWVINAARFAGKHPDCGAFGGRVVLDWEIPPPEFINQFHYSFAEQAHGDEAKSVSCLVGAGIIINRQVLLATGWIDRPFLADRVGKRLVSGGDVELALRLGAQRPLWYTPDCCLQHIIPAYRLSPRYLMRINYGLGTAKLYGDTMLWAGSYLPWLSASLKEGGKQFQQVAIEGAKAIMGKGSKTVVAINAHFWLGWCQGIWRLWWMKATQRQAILGSAVSRLKS